LGGILNRLKDVLRAGAYASVLAIPITFGHAQASTESYAVVKPCSNVDWALASGSEAKKLTKKLLENTGSFSSCETVAVSFLPDARILRLHTPVQVDYSYTATLLQSKRGDPFVLISSGRGLVVRPQPGNADSISALNGLLHEVKLRGDPKTIRIASELYFFILDGQDSASPIGPIAKREECLDNDPSRTLVTIGPRSARVIFEKTWRLEFEIENGMIQLASVNNSE